MLLFSHLGLRGSRLRDTLSASLLAFAIGAIAAVLIGSGISGDPPGAAVLIACVVALLAGHRFGAAVFRRLDDAPRTGTRRWQPSPSPVCSASSRR